MVEEWDGFLDCLVKRSIGECLLGRRQILLWDMQERKSDLNNGLWKVCKRIYARKYSAL